MRVEGPSGLGDWWSGDSSGAVGGPGRLWEGVPLSSGKAEERGHVAPTPSSLLGPFVPGRASYVTGRFPPLFPHKL